MRDKFPSSALLRASHAPRTTGRPSLRARAPCPGRLTAGRRPAAATNARRAFFPEAQPRVRPLADRACGGGIPGEDLRARGAPRARPESTITGLESTLSSAWGREGSAREARPLARGKNMDCGNHCPGQQPELFPRGPTPWRPSLGLSLPFATHPTCTAAVSPFRTGKKYVVPFSTCSCA